MKRSFIIGRDAIIVTESDIPDIVTVSVGGQTATISREEFKELTSLAYEVKFNEPAKVGDF